MIKPLPKWVLTENYPAFYDTESVTAIEMVAKLYGSMQELITDYNEFVDEINQAIQDFENGIINDFNDFKELIQGIVDDFIAEVREHMQDQDQAISDEFAIQNGKIDDAIDYMKTNLIATVTALYEAGFENGDYVSMVGIYYDAEDEELTIEDTLRHAESEEF